MMSFFMLIVISIITAIRTLASQRRLLRELQLVPDSSTGQQRLPREVQPIPDSSPLVQHTS
jgi:hypothetical protein